MDLSLSGDDPADHTQGHWLDDIIKGVAEAFEERDPMPKITSVNLYVFVFSHLQMMVLRPSNDNRDKVFFHSLTRKPNDQYGPKIHEEDTRGQAKAWKVIDYVLNEMLRKSIKKKQLRDLQFLDILFEWPIAADLTTNTSPDGRQERTLHFCVSITVTQCTATLTLRRDGTNETREISWISPVDPNDLLSIGPDPLPQLATDSYVRYLQSTQQHITTTLFPSFATLCSLIRQMLVECCRLRSVSTGTKVKHVLICHKNANPNLGVFLMSVSRHRFGKRDGNLAQSGEEHFTIMVRESLDATIHFYMDHWNHALLSFFIEDGGRLKSAKWVTCDA